MYFTASTPAEISTDACSPLPDSTPDLSPFVVVTSRGNCSFKDKIDHLLAKNATRILYSLPYSNVLIPSIINIPNLPLPGLDALSSNASGTLRSELF